MLVGYEPASASPPAVSSPGKKGKKIEVKIQSDARNRRK